ncbi:Hypothetical protein A7982_00975 [Minicystis rosea]|nr:Hypothetical protein A7982_00975 [Minicystis rosea]
MPFRGRADLAEEHAMSGIEALAEGAVAERRADPLKWRGPT